VEIMHSHSFIVQKYLQNGIGVVATQSCWQALLLKLGI
jgi:hypothetical protein